MRSSTPNEHTVVHSQSFDTPARLAGPVHEGTATRARELDSRTSDGIDVRLLWHPGDGHVSVVVNDTKTGEAFELPVRDGRHALEVFSHPYAYAG